MPGPFKYFLLDFDGVVADTESVFAAFDCRHLNETLALAGQAADLTPEIVRPMAGNPAETKLEMIAAERGFDAAPLMESFSERRNKARKTLFRDNPVPLGKGIEAFLEKHRRQSALVTNKQAFKLEQDILFTGLGSAFRAIITCDPPLRKKPAPDLLFRAMGILGAEAEETCYVGDNVLDIEAAINAGVTPVGFIIEGLENAPERVAELKKAGAKTVIDNFDDLPCE